MSLLCLCFAGLTLAAADDVPVSLVIQAPPSETASMVVRHLRSELDVPSRVDTSSRALTIEAALTDRAFEIRIDLERSAVRVRRAADGMVLQRSFDAALTDESPYAIALVAAELFRLARLRPADVERAAVGPDRYQVGAGLSAGVAASVAPAREPTLLAAKLGFDVTLRDVQANTVSAVGVRVAGPWSTAQTFGSTNIDYRRFDATLRLEFGLDHGVVSWGVAAEVGTAFTRAVALNVQGAEVSRSDRVLVSTVGGAFVERRLVAGLAIRGFLGVNGVLGSADYLVDGEVALSEASVRVIGEVVGVWRWD